MGWLIKFFNVFITLALTLFLSVPLVKADDSAGGAKTWTVMVGGEADVQQLEEGPAGSWQFMRFYPENLTINSGDTVVFKLHSAEPHTVTFPKTGEKSPDLVIPETSGNRMILNPLAVMPQGGDSFDGSRLTGSGQLDPGKDFPKEFKLTFTNPGEYEYFCAFHTKMKAKITVQPQGSSYPQTQEEVDAKAKDLLDKDTKDSETKKPADKVETTIGADGTTTYNINIGYGDGILSYMRFIPKNLTIKEGDSVNWIQQDVDTPHTITLTSGQKEPEFVLPEPQPDGPPKLVLNPDLLMPKGGNKYDGTGFINSGFLWGKESPMPGPRNFTLKFTKAGTYKYICALHDGMGMTAEIKVSSKTFIHFNTFGKKKITATLILIALAGGYFYWKSKQTPSK